MNYQQISQQPTTVGPLYSNSAPYGMQTLNGQQMNHQQSGQQSTTAGPVCLNTTPTGIKIYIKSHPRKAFRPRMEKESINTLHYLHCEKNSADVYPSIHISDTWRR
ncbi:unnamed protein product, partial [Adineta steineri]